MNAPQPATNMYPSISSEPRADRGGTESYYNRHSNSHADLYQRPQASYQEPTQPSSPYEGHDRGPSRTLSAYGTAPPVEHAHYNGSSNNYATDQQGYPQSPAQRQGWPSLHESQYQGYQGHQDGVSQTQIQTPAMLPPQTPTMPQAADLAAMFYHGGQEQVSPQQPMYQQRQDSMHDPSVPSPEQAQAPPPPQFLYGKSQNSAIAQQQQPDQWQQANTSAQAQQGQFMPDQPYPSHLPYTSDSFPSAPQHQPQPKAEESLIEL